MVNKKDDWHHERRIGEAVKAGIKCFCGGEAYRDILEVTMNGEAFPRVHRIFCPNCGLQMRSPAGNDEDFIVRQWRDISDLHQHRKEEQERADRSGVLKKIAQYFQEWSGAENTVAKLAFGPSELRVITAWYTNMISWRQRLDVNNEKQNPRVMSLQEIEAGEFDFAYLEYRVDGSDEFIDSIIKPVLIVWTLNNGIGMMHADNADLTEWKDEYNKTFRLWTAMPRPEYRRAAKWEETT